MIQSTKRDQFWSFWCQRGCNHQDQAVFWGKRDLEVAEVIEVAGAAEVNEAVKVSKAVKITTEVFRVLGLIIQWKISLYFDVSNKINVDRIIKYQVEYCHFFCQRQLRPTNVTFLKIDWLNSNVPISWMCCYLFLNLKVNFSWPSWTSKYVKSSWNTLY